MDFVSARTADGRWFRTLTVIDVFTRESLALIADRSLTGVKVAATLTPIVARRARRRRYVPPRPCHSSGLEWARSFV